MYLNRFRFYQTEQQSSKEKNARFDAQKERTQRVRSVGDAKKPVHFNTLKHSKFLQVWQRYTTLHSVNPKG